MTQRELLIQKITSQNLPSEEKIVSLDDFFLGNDDPGSIGCNLGEAQPPIQEFYRVLRAIRDKADVQDVLVRIYEYDNDGWPYSDTVYIISSASLTEIQRWIEPLMADEIQAGWMYGKPPFAPAVASPMVPYSVWWD